MKIIILFFTLTLLHQATFGQKVLDIEKLKECELFPNKGDFDNSKRLKQVMELRGKSITVYLLKRGKKNIIKNSYTGTIDFRLIDKDAELGKEHSVVVIPIKLESVARRYFAYFPHTNLKYYRLYRADCLKKN